MDCCSLENAVIPDGVRIIEQNTFSGCLSLESIKIPESVRSIKQGAFRSCEHLRNVILPEGVTEICDETFKECIYLEKINIPESVKVIGCNAFNKCEHLYYIRIPEDVEEIGEGAFYSCLLMREMVVLGRNTRMEGCGAGYGTFLDYNLYDGYFENSGKVGDDFTIHCRRRSLAEKYANKHRFKILYIKKGRNGGRTAERL